MVHTVCSGFSVLALDSATSEYLNLSAAEEPISVDNTFNKIHFYFDTAEHAFIDDMAELQSATASVKSDYAAAIMMAEDTEPSDENVYITVQFASDYLSDKTYLSLKSAREEAKTAEARDMAKSRQNAYSKSYHAAIVEDNLPLLADIPYTNANAIDYSSFVTLTVPAALLDTAVLAEVAENESILHISLTDGFEVVSESSTDTTLTNSEKTGWSDVLQCIGAKNTVLNGTYTGEGIKVGIYESGNVTPLPQVVMAALQSTANPTGDCTPLSNSDFDDRVGAGIVNLAKMLNEYTLTIQTFGNPNGMSGSIIFEHTQFVQSGMTLQISLAWLAVASGVPYQANGVTSGTKYVMNYNVYMYDGNGNEVVRSCCADSATELIRFTPSQSGYYYVVVRQIGAHVYNAPVTVARYYG